MNSILGMIDLASQKTMDQTSRDFLNTARSSADLLLTLLNDLLGLLENRGRQTGT